VHLVRQSLNFCGWKNRKAVAKHLKQIYQATHDRINGAKNIHPSHPHGGALDKG
jgi:transposase-like protein